MARHVEPQPGGGPWRDKARAVAALIVLTAVAGGLDGIAFLFFGRVFVSNQTGNILFMALRLVGKQQVDERAAASSLGCFVVAAALCGRLLGPVVRDGRWPRLALPVIGIEVVLIAAAAILAGITGAPNALVVAPLAAAMGIQVALARWMAIDYLTGGFLTGVLADPAISSLAGGAGRSWWYAATPIVALMVGAGGIALVAEVSVPFALAVCAGLAIAVLWIAAGRGPHRKRPVHLDR